MDVVLKKQVLTIKKQVPVMQINIRHGEIEGLHKELNRVLTSKEGFGMNCLRDLINHIEAVQGEFTGQDRILETVSGDIE